MAIDEDDECGGGAGRDGGRALNEEEALVKENWELFFPFDDFDPEHAWVRAVKLFRAFLKPGTGKGAGLLEGVDLEKATQVVFDFRQFCSLLTEPDPLAKFAASLRSNARMTLSCLGLAICSMRALQSADNGLNPVLTRISARFVAYRPLTSIRSLKSSHLGKFVAVRGTVVRVSGVRPMVKRMDFACPKCGESICKSMPDGKFAPPTHCENADCKGKVFKADKASAVTVDFQLVRLQEADEASNPTANGGAVPRTIDVELTEDLVDLVVPGDVVTICGIVKALNAESLTGKGSRAKGKNREASLLILILEANSIETKSLVASRPQGARVEAQNQSQSQSHALDFLREIRARNLGAGQGLTSQEAASTQRAPHVMAGGEDTKQKNDIVANLTEKDYAMIQLVSEKFDYSFLVHSLCPLILGQEHVKFGLLLGLAGGTGVAGRKSSVPIRGDIHVLVVGDPGLGKSQMLKAAAAVSPRGVYVCGNTASQSGLTVTMAKDKNGEHSLEAGALVLADRGVCCIDEFDKMQCDSAALLETMEQQSISIAKAGIVCTLSARTAILAAANPIGGRYNRNRTVLENLRMSAPLLSRFDLVFILVDRPDDRHDGNIAEYVVDMHLQHENEAGNSVAGSSQRTSSSSSATQASKRRRVRRGRPPPRKQTRPRAQPVQAFLHERVRAYEGTDPLPAELLRKYLAFAKHYCHPKLSLGACRVLQGFYLELREKGSSCESTPITTRQLESLVRLAQARARLELRDLVTEADAEDIVSLMQESLLDAFTDDSGVVDLQRSGGMSMAKLCKALVAQLKNVARQRGSTRFTVEQMKAEAQQAKILHQIPDFKELIEVLNQQCSGGAASAGESDLGTAVQVQLAAVGRRRYC
ncbi:DNA replication licensing factor, putative [Hondaea fermentalgiana]|uniref:DNA helicase n=1 Tax=Hondaea fermentalgiana TaxID=2315210 RepID=A0A2R5GBA6_9STRA|nr:DNA replication licensing factor, putative [Hondaea fermentalgiana]|eukprot:GBG26988.1 DNA replication licensing factor, putative [Hondaea fermentalgiana]